MRLLALLAALGLGAAAPARTGQESAAFASSAGWAGAPPLWSDRFGTANDDWTNSVLELADGAILAAGFVNRSDDAAPPGWDLIVRRYRPDGTLLWSRRIGGDGLDAAWAAAELADGRIVLAGPSASDSAGGTDAWLLMLDAAGETIWERRYGGADEDFVTGLDATRDGGFVLAGWTRSIGAGGRDLLVVRTDRDGRELWRRAYGGPGTERGFHVRAVADGYVVAGVSGEPEAYDMLLMKLDERGELLWRRVVGGPGNDPTHALLVRPNGEILLLGYTRSWGARDYDLAALSFAADGRLLRQELLGGPGDDRLQAGALASDGSVWVTGYTRSFAGHWDVLVARLRADGSFEPWLGALDGGGGDDHGSAIATARDGTLMIGGYTASGNREAGVDAFAMRLRPEGILRRSEGVAARSVGVGDPAQPG